MTPKPECPRPPERPVRLDRAVVQRGLTASRGRAQQLIVAGQVLVDGIPVRRTATPVPVAASLRLAGGSDGYVSRAAYKLLEALTELDLTPAGRALDAGASTGGFTQVLLERGCREVVCVDVGHDQLAPTVRADPRVRVHEGLHLRDLTSSHVGGMPLDWAVADVSFVSLTKVLAPIVGVLDPSATLLALVKPQFEVGRGLLSKSGVVRDPARHRGAVLAVVDAAGRLGWQLQTAVPSRLPGTAGNREFFVLLRRTPPATVLDLTGLRLHRPDPPTRPDPTRWPESPSRPAEPTRRPDPPTRPAEPTR